MLRAVIVVLWSLKTCSESGALKSVQDFQSSGLLHTCIMGVLSHRGDRSTILRIRGGDSHQSQQDDSKEIQRLKAKSSKRKIGTSIKSASVKDKKNSKTNSNGNQKRKKKSKSNTRIDWSTWRKIPKGKSRYGSDVVAGSGPMLYQVRCSVLCCH